MVLWSCAAMLGVEIDDSFVQQIRLWYEPKQHNEQPLLLQL